MRIYVIVFFVGVGSSLSDAQQVTVATPLHGGGAGFFEHIGVGLGFQHVGRDGMMFFQSGGGFGSWPPFGGFHPADASTFAIGGRMGEMRWNLNVSALQGYSSSRVSASPYLTLENGRFGFLNNTVQRPFVRSFLPVVNGDPQMQRELVLRRYADSASRFVAERQQQRRVEADEQERLEKESRERSQQRRGSPRPTEPPLRLGNRPDAELNNDSHAPRR